MIDESRVLTYNLGEFSVMEERAKPEDVADKYNSVGVHYSGVGSIEDFLKNVPDNAKYVIKFRAHFSGRGSYGEPIYNADGVALIPKEEAEQGMRFYERTPL